MGDKKLETYTTPGGHEWVTDNDPETPGWECDTNPHFWICPTDDKSHWEIWGDSDDDEPLPEVFPTAQLAMQWVDKLLDPSTLSDIVVELAAKLKARGETISVAESLTSGLVQSALASESGASQFFAGGITTYNIDQKVEHLGVDGTHASKVDSVSIHVACQMAEGVRKMFNTDIGLATTGFADSIPEPYAEVAISFAASDGDPESLIYWRVVPEVTGRTAVREAVVETLLAELTRILV